MFDGTHTNENKPQITAAPILDTIVDNDGAGTVYTGKSFVGAVEGDDVWLIKKAVTAGDITTTRYASAQFDKSWTDRATYF